jgi:hypothetical protein
MTRDDEWIARFEAFARSKPADERYITYNPGTCALAQFGYPFADSGSLKRLGIPDAAYSAAVGVSPQAATFGALADRLHRIVEQGKAS